MNSGLSTVPTMTSWRTRPFRTAVEAVAGVEAVRVGKGGVDGHLVGASRIGEPALAQIGTFSAGSPEGGSDRMRPVDRLGEAGDVEHGVAGDAGFDRLHPRDRGDLLDERKRCAPAVAKTSAKRLRS